LFRVRECKEHRIELESRRKLVRCEYWRVRLGDLELKDVPGGQPPGGTHQAKCSDRRTACPNIFVLAACDQYPLTSARVNIPEAHHQVGVGARHSEQKADHWRSDDRERLGCWPAPTRSARIGWHRLACEWAVHSAGLGCPR